MFVNHDDWLLSVLHSSFIFIPEGAKSLETYDGLKASVVF